MRSWIYYRAKYKPLVRSSSLSPALSLPGFKRSTYLETLGFLHPRSPEIDKTRPLCTMDKTKSKLAAFFDDDEDSSFPVRWIEFILYSSMLTN
jgi:hypothetical protein